MDLSRPVTYRGLNLNTASAAGPGGAMSGILIEQVMYGGVQGVGYTEKRSLQDGFDASDIYLAKRIVRMRVVVYGTSRADFYDRLQELRATVHPTAAYLDDPAAYGYLPLAFEEPTLDIVSYGMEYLDGDPLGYGYRPLFLNARPLATPDVVEDRDRTGGVDTKGIAMPVTLAWDCIDPRVYVQDELLYDLAGSGTGTVDPIVNRGDYPTPINVLLNIDAAASSGSVTFTAGTAQFKIVIPDSTNDQIIRYSGYKKALTIEENGQEVLRMDCLDLLGEDTHPQIMPGVSSVDWAGNVAFDTNSRFWFHEAYA